MFILQIFKSRNNTSFIITLIILILIIYTSDLNSTPLSDLTTMSNCQISGTITDVSTMTVVDNAKISLLDPLTREGLYTDIYTDENGMYDADVQLDFTGISTENPIMPSAYLISEFHPNPAGLEGNRTVIHYHVPNNIPEIPVIELYNILGRKVNHEDYLTSGIYICRLRFHNGHLSEPKKLMMTSGGILNLSLNQVFENRDRSLRKPQPDMAHTHETDDTLEVLFQIEKSGYACMERSRNLIQDMNNVTDFALIPAGNQSVAVLDTTGGVVKVANSRNDTITLTIPRYALWEPTTITLTTFDNQPINPIHENIFPGVNIAPGGFRPHRPVTLKVTFATTEVDTQLSTLFYIKQSDFVLPLGNLSVTDSSIEGEIYHFSDYSGGDPSQSEVLDQAGKAAEGGALNPYDWQGTYDMVKALIRWSQMLELFENEVEAEAKFNEAKEILKRDAENFINQPVPDDPCGWYRNTFIKFYEMVSSHLTLSDGDLLSRYIDRFNELFNECGIQGDITCHYVLEQQAAATKWDIKGIVPFSGSPSTLGQFAGDGEANIVVTGHPGDCVTTGYGTNTISLDGEVTADIQGYIWLDVNWTEAWWTTSSITTTCPDDPPVTYSQPQHTDENFLRFLAVNNAVVGRPNGFTWTLHLYSLFPEPE